jgi:hypothetical protein
MRKRFLGFSLGWVLALSGCGLSLEQRGSSNSERSPDRPVLVAEDAYEYPTPAEILSWQSWYFYQSVVSSPLLKLGIRNTTPDFVALTYILGKKTAVLSNHSARLRERVATEPQIEQWYLAAFEVLDTMAVLEKRAGTVGIGTTFDIFHSESARVLFANSIPGLQRDKVPNVLRGRFIALIQQIGEHELTKPLTTVDVEKETRDFDFMKVAGTIAITTDLEWSREPLKLAEELEDRNTKLRKQVATRAIPLVAFAYAEVSLRQEQFSRAMKEKPDTVDRQAAIQTNGMFEALERDKQLLARAAL